MGRLDQLCDWAFCESQLPHKTAESKGHCRSPDLYSNLTVGMNYLLDSSVTNFAFWFAHLTNSGKLCVLTSLRFMIVSSVSQPLIRGETLTLSTFLFTHVFRCKLFLRALDKI